MDYCYTTREYFGPEKGDGWNKYINWSNLMQLKELVSLDSMLNGLAFDVDYNNDEKAIESAIIHDNFTTDLFNSLDFVIERSGKISKYNLLTVVKEPEEPCEEILVENFTFLGYDLIDNTFSRISALSNCGGFDETFLPGDLNEYGLIDKHKNAIEISDKLYQNNPDEVHANCLVMAIWRHNTLGR